MSILRFPNRPIVNPVVELGISEVPLPAMYALRDMNKASERYFSALAYETHANAMPSEVRKRAVDDLLKYQELLNPTNIGGISVVKDEDIVRFVHRVTGHPLAWVLSWQLHAHAQSITGLKVDKHLAKGKFMELADKAMSAITSGYNREF